MSAAESSFHKNVISATDNDAAAPPPKASSDSPPNMNGSKVSPPPPPQPPERSGGDDGGDGDSKAVVAAASAPMTATGNEKKRHHHRQRHRRLRGRPRSSNEGRRSVGLSGGSTADNDASYCTEIARRSVARAALHLGMEGMEGEALDVLGSVMLGYMEMVRF